MVTLRAVAVLLIVVFLDSDYAASSCSPGPKAVRWTLYTKMINTWNEASEFCKQRGGHLPITNSDVTMSGLQNAVTAWNDNKLISNDFWIGLHSAVRDTIPNVWETNCAILPPGVDHWDYAAKEPDKLDTSQCTRVTRDKGLWRTKECEDPYLVLCEEVRGNCTYQLMPNVTMMQYPNASKAYVSDVESCFTLCLELRLNGQECVAAELDKSSICKLYLGTALLEEPHIQTALSAGSNIMLRRCFESARDSNAYSSFSFSNSASAPQPANASCPEVYQDGRALTDCMPPGVEAGLVTLSTTPATTTQVATTTTVGTTTVTATSESARTTAATTPEPATTVIATTSEPATTTTAITSESATTTTARTPESAKTSFETSTQPETTVTTLGAVTSVTSETTTMAADVTTNEDTTTEMTKTTDKMTSVRVVESTKASEGTTSSNYNVTTATDHTQASPGLCQCSCKLQNNVTSTNNTTESTSAAEFIVLKNSTSKYRRSKTSSLMTQFSYTVIGSTWIAASASVLGLFVLCDLQRVAKWAGDRKRNRCVPIPVNRISTT